MSTDNATNPPGRSGRIWTQEPGGRTVVLEDVMLLRPGGRLCSLPCERWVPPNPDHPVRVHFVVDMGDAGALERHIDLRAGDWLCLRSMRAGGGVLEWLLNPAVQAEFRPQAWHRDTAVDLDDGVVRLDALHAALRELPDARSFCRQAAVDEWYALVTHVPGANAHSGPFDVRFPHVLVAALAALYRGDADALSDTLRGAADALDWLRDDDWKRLKALVGLLAPEQVLTRHRLVLAFEVESSATSVQELTSEEIGAALAALSRDSNLASRVFQQDDDQGGGALQQRQRG